VAGDWRRLHNAELHKLYTSPNVIRVIKSRRMLWVWHVARMGEMRSAYSILIGELNGRDHLDDLGKDGKILLECMSGK